jgi:Secretion system C-terminal sorting domain
MIKLLLTSCALLLIAFQLSFAQTTAMDWTKDDCNGINHNCFTELDSGNVLLCEYVMTCGTCISAANYLEQMYQDYALSNPGKVKFYAIDWNASFTCSTFQNWGSALSCTLFLNGYNEVNYYGGMGMPTIVVLGGTDHHVYYSKLGYSHSADDANVRAAIDEALNQTGISENNSAVSSLSIYPNPAVESTTITYSLETPSFVSIEVLNMLGEKVNSANLGLQPEGENHYLLNTEMLNSGLYFIQITNGTLKESRKLIVMK